MFQNGQTWGNIVFPGSNDIETSTVVHVHHQEESLFSLLLLAETVHAASNRVFIADRLEIKLQPMKFRLFGLLASLSSLNVADDHCKDFFFSFFENFETFLFDHDMPPLAQEHAKPNSCFLGREDSHGRRNTVLDVGGRQLVHMRLYSYLVYVRAAAEYPNTRNIIQSNLT